MIRDIGALTRSSIIGRSDYPKAPLIPPRFEAATTLLTDRSLESETLKWRVPSIEDIITFILALSKTRARDCHREPRDKIE
jgi:hypothetical protein